MAIIHKARVRLQFKETLFKPGDRVPPEVISALGPKEVAVLETQGHLIVAGADAQVHDAPPSNPAFVQKENEKGETDLGLKKMPPPPPRAQGLWNCDPNDLKGKSFEQLRALIAERDPNRVLPSTPEDCVAALTEDFEG